MLCMGHGRTGVTPSRIRYGCNITFLGDLRNGGLRQGRERRSAPNGIPFLGSDPLHEVKHTRTHMHIHTHAEARTHTHTYTVPRPHLANTNRISSAMVGDAQLHNHVAGERRGRRRRRHGCYAGAGTAQPASPVSKRRISASVGRGMESGHGRSVESMCVCVIYTFMYVGMRVCARACAGV